MMSFIMQILEGHYFLFKKIVSELLHVFFVENPVKMIIRRLEKDKCCLLLYICIEHRDFGFRLMR